MSHHHENTAAVINRLSRAIGHLEAVKRMVEAVSYTHLSMFCISMTMTR